MHQSYGPSDPLTNKSFSLPETPKKRLSATFEELTAALGNKCKSNSDAASRGELAESGDQAVLLPAVLSSGLQVWDG